MRGSIKKHTDTFKREHEDRYRVTVEKHTLNTFSLAGCKSMS